MSNKNNSAATIDKPNQSSDTFRTGIDELNLAELPIATLGRRDTRGVLEYTFREKIDGVLQKTIWIVEGGQRTGLPTEFAERVLVALMAITEKQGFTDAERKVTFTVYEVLKLMGLSFGKNNYKLVRKAVRQLKNVTIHSDKTFYDKKADGWVDFEEEGFNLIDNSGMRGRVKKGAIREGKSYIIWNTHFWNNFQSRHIKYLDLEFYFSLENVIARRLYRLLDHKFKKYNRNDWYRDIFEVASRLGMSSNYPKPAQVKRKMMPGITELIERGFLREVRPEVEYRGDKRYTRLHFFKNPSFQTTLEKIKQQKTEAHSNGAGHTDAETELPEPDNKQQELLMQLREQYGYDTTEWELEVWPQVQQSLKRQMTQATYDAQLAQSQLLHLTDEKAVIGVPNEFAQEWLANRLKATILRTLASHIDDQLEDLEVVVLN